MSFIQAAQSSSFPSFESHVPSASDGEIKEFLRNIQVTLKIKVLDDEELIEFLKGLSCEERKGVMAKAEQVSARLPDAAKRYVDFLLKAIAKIPREEGAGEMMDLIVKLLQHVNSWQVYFSRNAPYASDLLLCILCQLSVENWKKAIEYFVSFEDLQNPHYSGLQPFIFSVISNLLSEKQLFANDLFSDEYEQNNCRKREIMIIPPQSYLPKIAEQAMQQIAKGSERGVVINEFLTKVRFYLGKEEGYRYVIRGAGWEKIMSYGAQDLYGQLMHQGKLDISCATAPYAATFEELLVLSAAHRQYVAERCGHRDSDAYGRLRKVDSSTCCDHQYLKLGEELCEKIGGGDSDNFDVVYFDGRLFDLIASPVMTTLDGKQAPLTRIVRDGNRIRLLHADIEEAKSITPYCEKLYQQILAEQDPVFVVEKCLEIFWLICHQKPWDLGDPSIVEESMRVIFDQKGIENPAWKPGVIPWAEAMKEWDREAFSRNGWKLFEWSPEMLALFQAREKEREAASAAHKSQ